MFIDELAVGQGWGGVYGVYVALLAGFLLDVRVGDPRWLYGRVRHPVVMVGDVGSWLEARLNRERPVWALLGGVVTLVVVVVVSGGVGFGVVALSDGIGGLGGLVVEGLAVWTLLSYGDLRDRVRDVQAGLEQSPEEGLSRGRAAAGHIVGRETADLDESEVCSATLESLGENFSDGVVGPLFWGVLFGLPGVAIYKAVNTLDSMYGYRGGRYEYFGKVMARLDDVLSYVPARMSGVILGMSGVILGRGIGGFVVSFRDGGRHESVNAGWPEGAMAGVLGVRLGGKRVYGARVVEGASLGTGRERLAVSDIAAGLRVYRTSGWVVLALLAAGGVIHGG